MASFNQGTGGAGGNYAVRLDVTPTFPVSVFVTDEQTAQPPAVTRFGNDGEAWYTAASCGTWGSSAGTAGGSNISNWVSVPTGFRGGDGASMSRGGGGGAAGPNWYGQHTTSYEGGLPNTSSPTGSPGNPNFAWDATHKPGAGGNGGVDNFSFGLRGQPGHPYGGGGGGSIGFSNPLDGLGVPQRGGPGIIVITYPRVLPTAAMILV